MLLWLRSSNLSEFFFVAILLLLSIEPTTPVPSRVASQWRERPSSYNGDHNSSEMAGASPVGRRALTTRTTPSKYVRTTLLCGAHSSSQILVPGKTSVHMGWLSHTSNQPPLYGQEGEETNPLAYEGDASSPPSSCCATRAWGERATCRLLCHG